MDALHASCPAFPKSRELSKSIENVFLDIKDSISLVLDPLTQPLSWLLEGSLWLFETTPWWIMIPALLAIVMLVGRSLVLVCFVAAGLIGFAFVDYYSFAVQTLAVIFVCSLLCVIIGVPIGIAMSRSDRLQRSVIPILDMLQTLPPSYI